MPNLLRFEGNTPEEARRKAAEALGNDVVIVRAGRERSGGLLGFFEHEVFVLEIDAEASSPAPATAGEQQRSTRRRPPAGDRLDALAEDVQDDLDIPSLGSRRAAPTRRFCAEDLPPPAGDAARAPLLPEAAPAAPLASISREFSEVLEEAEATVAAARAGGDDDLLTALSSATVDGVLPPARCEPPPAPTGPPRPVALAGPEAAEDGHTAALETVRRRGRGRGHADVELDGGEQASHSPVAGLLRDLGLPDRLLPELGEPADLGLLAKLRQLPPAPPLPDEPDAVVLVAGSAQHLGSLSLSLARRLGIGAEAVIAVSTRPQRLLASAAYVASARDAAAEVADRRIARRPSVVAVDARVAGPLPRVIAEVTSAVRPDACWAVVPARTDLDQLHALAEALRGIDALCLVELDEAERPAAALAGGYPVAALDRRAATPLMWAARLLDRCASEWVTP